MACQPSPGLHSLLGCTDSSSWYGAWELAPGGGCSKQYCLGWLESTKNFVSQIGAALAGEHRRRRPPTGFDSTFTGRGPQGAFGSGGHQEIYCAYDNAQVQQHVFRQQSLYSTLPQRMITCGSCN
jgi:hypothetical protein